MLPLECQYLACFPFFAGERRVCGWTRLLLRFVGSSAKVSSLKLLERVCCEIWGDGQWFNDSHLPQFVALAISFIFDMNSLSYNKCPKVYPILWSSFSHIFVLKLPHTSCNCRRASNYSFQIVVRKKTFLVSFGRFPGVRMNGWEIK